MKAFLGVISMPGVGCPALYLVPVPRTCTCTLYLYLVRTSYLYLYLYLVPVPVPVPRADIGGRVWAFLKWAKCDVCEFTLPPHEFLIDMKLQVPASHYWLLQERST
jgi:hypothetical protein